MAITIISIITIIAITTITITTIITIIPMITIITILMAILLIVVTIIITTIVIECHRPSALRAELLTWFGRLPHALKEPRSPLCPGSANALPCKCELNAESVLAP